MLTQLLYAAKAIFLVDVPIALLLSSVFEDDDQRKEESEISSYDKLASGNSAR